MSKFKGGDRVKPTMERDPVPIGRAPTSSGTVRRMLSSYAGLIRSLLHHPSPQEKDK